MRNPENLTHEELVTIVSAIQDRLYLDIVDDKELYNWEKEWSPSDVCEIVAYILSEYGLTPNSCEEEKEDASRP